MLYIAILNFQCLPLHDPFFYADLHYCIFKHLHDLIVYTDIYDYILKHLHGLNVYT